MVTCYLMLQEQLDAMKLNLSILDSGLEQPAMHGSELNDMLADQMLNVTKTPDEYDPEELYDPSEGL